MKRKSLATSQVIEFLPQKFYYGVLRDALWASTGVDSMHTTSGTSISTATAAEDTINASSSASTSNHTSLHTPADPSRGFADFFHPKAVRCIPIDEFLGGARGQDDTVHHPRFHHLNLARVVQFCRFLNHFVGAQADEFLHLLTQEAPGHARRNTTDNTVNNHESSSPCAITPACSPTTVSPVKRRTLSLASSSAAASASTASMAASASSWSSASPSNGQFPMQPNEPNPLCQRQARIANLHGTGANGLDTKTTARDQVPAGNLGGTLSSANSTIVWCFHHRRHGEFEFEAVFLICCWRVLCLKLSPKDALACFEQCHFQSCWLHHFDLASTLQAIEKSFGTQLICSSVDDFNLLEWQHLQQPQNGAISWITRRLFTCDANWKSSAVSPMDSTGIASSSSTSRSCGLGLESFVTPDQLTPYYRQRNVTLVIRINALLEEAYDAQKFTSAGIQHLDLRCDHEQVRIDPGWVQQFLDACESTSRSSVVAVHCSRHSTLPAVLIGCWLMKHSHFTAAEAINWLFLCRPAHGVVSQWQSSFLQDMEPQMWRDGADFLRQQEEQQQARLATRSTGAAGAGAGAGGGSLSSRSHLQINIGNISLGGKSLLGTLDTNDFDADRFHVSSMACSSDGTRRDSSGVNGTGSSSGGGGGAGTGSLHTFKRRPFTQGARRLHEHGSDVNSPVEASKSTSNFAALHKFLHHSSGSHSHSNSHSNSSSTTTSSSSSSSSSTPTRCVSVALPVTSSASLAASGSPRNSSPSAFAASKLTKLLPSLAVHRSASTAPDISMASQLN